MPEHRTHNAGVLRQCRLIFILCMGIILAGCASDRAWRSSVDWEDYSLDELPGDAGYPEADAIVLLNQGEMRVSDSGELDLSYYSHHRIIRILSTRGLRHANVAIPYSSGSTVKNIRARTILPSGEIRVLKPENIYDITLYPNFVFYSDQRAKLFTMPAVEPGAIVEYRYQIEIDRLTIWHGWYFQENIPVLLSRFTLLNPSSWDIKYRTYNIDIPVEKTEAPAGFQEKYHWEARNIPEMTAEYGMPPKRKVRGRLAFSPVGVEEWQDVGDWYYKLIQSRIQPGGEVGALAERLTRGVNDEKEKLRILYQWVRDRVRYIAVEIGIGGFQPSPAREVLSNQYGDCKDMVTLLCSMARSLDIEAHQALVSTHQNGIPDTTLPSPYHFNHLITYCPGIGEDGIWLDATAVGSPFGQLPWYDQGLPVLRIDEKGNAGFLITPESSADTNVTEIRWEVTLDSSGEATVSGREQRYGVPGIEWRSDVLGATREERQRLLARELAERVSGAELDSMNFTGLQPVQEPGEIYYRFHSPSFAMIQGDQYAFQPGTFYGLNLPDYFRSRKRTHPVQLRYGFTRKFNLSIELPENWSILSELGTDSVRSEFGKGVWKWEQEGSQVEGEIKYTINRKRITPEAYPRFRAFLDSLRSHDLRQIAFQVADREKQR